jgi:hypothetical protein
VPDAPADAAPAEAPAADEPQTSGEEVPAAPETGAEMHEAGVEHQDRAPREQAAGAEPAADSTPDAPAEPAADEPQTSGEEVPAAPETGAEMHEAGAEHQDRASREEAASAEGSADGKPKKRRSRNRGAKAWGMKAAAQDAVPTVDLTSSGEGVPKGQQQARPKGKRPPRQRPPREKGPLPFNELREAAKAIIDMHGSRNALRDAIGQLAPKERAQLSEMVARDQDFRVRARSISAGSLSAGKLGKALAAQQVAIADVEDLWSFTLSKEEAAARQARVRNAKRRDDDRARRQAERRNSADRISKEDMEKARDGSVGAQVRIVVAGENDRDRKKTKKPKKPAGNNVLDKFGY